MGHEDMADDRKRLGVSLGHVGYRQLHVNKDTIPRRRKGNHLSLLQTWQGGFCEKDMSIDHQAMNAALVSPFWHDPKQQ